VHVCMLGCSGDEIQRSRANEHECGDQQKLAWNIGGGDHDGDTRDSPSNQSL